MEKKETKSSLLKLISCLPGRKNQVGKLKMRLKVTGIIDQLKKDIERLK